MNLLHAFLHAPIKIPKFLFTVPMYTFACTRKEHKRKRLLFVIICVKALHQGFLSAADYRRRIEF